MTKRERDNYVALLQRAERMGLDGADLDTLLKCERTLHRWAERECGDGSNWAIERDDETGRPFMVNHGGNNRIRYAIPDRERGALKRAAAVVAGKGLAIYHQTDPRGCALYVYFPNSLGMKDDINSCYSSIGLAVTL